MVCDLKRGTYVRCFSALRVALSTADLASSALPDPCPRMPCSRPSSVLSNAYSMTCEMAPINSKSTQADSAPPCMHYTSVGDMRSWHVPSGCWCLVQCRLTHLLVADHDQRRVPLDAARPGALAGAVHIHHLQGMTLAERIERQFSRAAGTTRQLRQACVSPDGVACWGQAHLHGEVASLRRFQILRQALG